jgi:hypothetical protein
MVPTLLDTSTKRSGIAKSFWRFIHLTAASRTLKTVGIIFVQARQDITILAPVLDLLTVVVLTENGLRASCTLAMRGTQWEKPAIRLSRDGRVQSAITLNTGVRRHTIEFHET